MKLFIITMLLLGIGGLENYNAEESKLPAGITNSQNPKDKPLSPQEALKKITVPKGFHVSLFAAEPDVFQPVAMTFDDRGRLWVLEFFSYPKWKPTGKDQIIIFEDTDNDGKFDKRKIFWNKGNYSSGLIYGHGGIWVCNTPNLIFIPDRNGDDIPDGPPEVILDGWSKDSKANVVNNLNWGPDGWLYGNIGCNRISYIGKPGTPKKQRKQISRGIWRYHPQKKVFEVVANGAVNPWGLDWNDMGEPFFTNCVLKHLWHLIPGGYYKRRTGESDNPYTFGRLGPICDHIHWAGGNWTSSRGSKAAHDAPGGGHAHTGAMVYLGDNWPDKYRHTIFMNNIHGHRINNDILKRSKSSYIGLHGKDFLKANDDWFRCLSLKYGPDGAVFMIDWQDYGECHDSDGVHRSSGRIYKVHYGKMPTLKKFDLQKLSNQELVKLQEHKNEWYVRHARRILQERASNGVKIKAVHKDLLKLFRKKTTPVNHKLRALWALHVTNGLSWQYILELLDYPNEHIRSWAIRIFAEDCTPSNSIFSGLIQQSLKLQAQEDKSALVRLYYASVLQRFSAISRLAIAEGLITHAEDASDPHIPLMIWYGIEAAVVKYPQFAMQLAKTSKIPLIRKFIARRIASNSYEKLLDFIVQLDTPQKQLDMLSGLQQGLQGQRNLKQPTRWPAIYKRLSQSKYPSIRKIAFNLAINFGDQKVISKLRNTIYDKQLTAKERIEALRLAIANQVKLSASDLQKLLSEKPLRKAVIRSLASIKHRDTSTILLKSYPDYDKQEKEEVITTLVSRRTWTADLLNSVQQKKIPATDISAINARSIHTHNDKKMNALLAKHWGNIRKPEKETLALINKYERKLTPKYLKTANLPNGRLLFKNNCAECHKLFGEGKNIGPELTGSDRKNLHYMLENILDPRAVIEKSFRVTVINTKDGRVISGLLQRKTDKIVELITVKEKVLIDRTDIERIRISRLSMMPDGLFMKLTPNEIRDLLAYLATDKQVPLPKESSLKKLSP